MNNEKNNNITFLTNAESAVIHAIFYLQTQDINVNNVIVEGNREKYYLLVEYSQTKNFSLNFVDKLNSIKTIRLLESIEPYIMFIMCSRILNSEIIKIPEHTINVHAGILPKYRGFDVRRWAILEGGEIGVSAHYVDETADTGDIILTRTLNIEPGDTIKSISSRNYYKNRYIVLSKAIKQILNNKVEPQKQNLEDGKRYFWMHDKLKKIVNEKLELLKVKITNKTY